MKYPKSELFEKLADIEHERWADWQRYVHTKLGYTEYKVEGTTVAAYLLPAEDFEHWEKQIDSGYLELSEEDKDKDRKQVMRYWKLIKQKYERRIL